MQSTRINNCVRSTIAVYHECHNLKANNYRIYTYVNCVGIKSKDTEFFFCRDWRINESARRDTLLCCTCSNDIDETDRHQDAPPPPALGVVPVTKVPRTSCCINQHAPGGT